MNGPRIMAENMSSRSESQADAGNHCEFLGIRVDLLDITGLNALAVKAANDKEKIVIANHNLHSLYVFHNDRRMRNFHEKVVKRTHIDGMGIVFLGRLLGHPLRRIHRVTYIDWMRPLLTEASRLGWRVFFMGLRSSTCQEAAAVIRRVAPGVEFHAEHWDPSQLTQVEANERMLAQISAFSPEILLVGLGMPRQEAWILENYERLRANVILPCGAAMDYIVGVVPTPPRWAGRCGLEWAFRFVKQPRHLWRRYLVEPWYVLQLLCLEILRGGPSVRSPRSVKDSIQR